MSRISRLTVILGGIGALVTVLLLWHGLNAEPATTQGLGGPDRFLTHVSTDKPMYRPGERVYIRGVILHALKGVPQPQGQNVQGFIAIKGPKGDVVASGYVYSQDSVLGFQWPIPEGQAGGEYKVMVTYPSFGNAPAERKFDIRVYRAPRLKNQIIFVRKGYGPGDTVMATLKTKRAEGGIPVGANVKIIARVDGVEVYTSTTTVDDSGHARAQFALPNVISRGEGTLAFAIKDGGVVETATKTIPILLQTVDLNLYPEGGDLVAGMPSRLYIQARTPAQKPADIRGVVVDGKGKIVMRFSTEHEGRGRFALTPVKNEKYTLKITAPSGIKTTYPLPEVKSSGGIIQGIGDVTPKGKPVKVRVGATSAGTYTITLKKREVLVAEQKVALKAGTPKEISLVPLQEQSAQGVLIVTLWDKGGTPLAERLVYRQPAQELNLQIVADKKQYIPGGTVNLTIKSLDANGKPVSAMVGMTVTDDSVLEMVDKREQAPRLPVMVLVENEVQELADAHVYLDTTNKKAPKALDLLMGTQGWRRFAFMDTSTFLATHKNKARRVLAYKQLLAHPTRIPSPRPDKGLKVKRDKLKRVPKVHRKIEKLHKPEKLKPKPIAKHPAAKRPPRAGGKKSKKKEVAKDVGKIMPMEEIMAGDEDLEFDAKSMREPRQRNSFVVVREYAHKVRPNRQPGERRDFTETLYWNAGVRTDATTGEAKLSFGLNDSVTSFRIMADGFGVDGALGMATSKIKSVEPFYIEPKLPLEVSAGDEILLPISVVNGTADTFSGATLKVDAKGEIELGTIAPFDLQAKGRLRRILPMKIGFLNEKTDVTIQAKAGTYADKVIRPLRVVPSGFPVEVGFGGLLDKNSLVRHQIEIPAQVVPRSITTQINIFPTPLANLTGALERLIREPYGCFEQTSSTTYPLVMAQQYFKSHANVDPKLVERSSTLLDKGYKRLKGFECKAKGYEWFGKDPGHEALTAYGLLEFSDMAQVYTVDADMLSRTRDWLLKTKDGEGGFTRKRRALHTWIVDKDCSNGYILWALLESGQTTGDLAKEIGAFKEAAKSSSNSYVTALGANVMALAKNRTAAKALMKELASKQTKEGWVDGATTSIVGSGGNALKIETTSLAVLAWLRDPAYAMNVEKGIQYLAEACKAGRYGSTQSTVLALRAIVAYDKARSKPKAHGKVRVFVDKQQVGGSVGFSPDSNGTITLPDISELLTPGTHTIRLEMMDGSAMPYAIAVNYNDTLPISSAQTKVKLRVSLNNTKMLEGGITEAQVIMANTSEEPVPTPVAIIGLPGGLEPRHARLKELVKEGQIAAYEVLGRDIVLYWRSLKGSETRNLNISLVAGVPGTYQGPASRAYLYYTDEFKDWTEGLKVTIKPRTN